MNFTFNAAALANPGSWFSWAPAPSAAASPAAPLSEQHALANRQMVKFPHPLGQLIVCTEGTLWVTVDGEDEDHVLERGDSFYATSNSPVIVAALSLARMTVHPAAR
jgi:Protein of unknown function (DUF2917)